MENYISLLTKRAIYGEQTFYQEDTLVCDRCRRFTAQVRQIKRPIHGLHLLISIVTLGLWLPVWAYFIFARSAVNGRVKLVG